MGVSEPDGTTSEKSDSDPSSARSLARTSHRRTAGRLHGYVERADVIIARARPRLDHLRTLSLFGGTATRPLFDPLRLRGQSERQDDPGRRRLLLLREGALVPVEVAAFGEDELDRLHGSPVAVQSEAERDDPARAGGR